MAGGGGEAGCCSGGGASFFELMRLERRDGIGPIGDLSAVVLRKLNCRES